MIRVLRSLMLAFLVSLSLIVGVAAAAAAPAPTRGFAVPVPTNLTILRWVGRNQISISWFAADPGGNTTYHVYVNGTRYTTTGSNPVLNLGMADSTAVTVTVAAVDTNGNDGPQSGAITAAAYGQGTAAGTSGARGTGTPPPIVLPTLPVVSAGKR